MPRYEYKIHCGPPNGMALMPWASQSIRDQVGRGSFERQLNQLAAEGWEVVSCSLASRGHLFWMSSEALVLLRREQPGEWAFRRAGSV